MKIGTSLDSAAGGKKKKKQNKETKKHKIFHKGVYSSVRIYS